MVYLILALGCGPPGRPTPLPNTIPTIPAPTPPPAPTVPTPTPTPEPTTTPETVAAGPFTDTPTWSWTGDAINGQAGTSIAGGEDVNGDGFDDIAIGQPYTHAGSFDSGRVVVFHGSRTGPAADYDWEWAPDHPAYFGSAVALLDANGDGYGDLAVGAWLDGPMPGEGRAYLYLGGPTGLATLSAWEWSPGIDNAHLGQSLAPAGDVDGDGFDDLLVRQPGPIGDTELYLFYGHPTGLEATPGRSLGAATSCDEVEGTGAGDVDGDGFDDLLVWTPSTFGTAGCGVVLYGPALTEDAWRPFPDDQSTPRTTLVGGGDVDADGLADVAVAASSDPTTAAQVFLGRANGLTPVPVWELDADYASLVAFVGDVDIDGYGELALVSAQVGETTTLHIYRGGPSGLEAVPAWTLDQTHTPAAAGDVDGDGASEVLVADPFADNRRGTVYLYGEPGTWTPL